MNYPAAVVLSSAPQLEPGKEATLVFSLDTSVKIGRDLQFKLTTENGFTVTHIIRTGEQKLI